MDRELKELIIEGLCLIGGNLLFLVLFLVYRFIIIPGIFNIIEEGIK